MSLLFSPFPLHMCYMFLITGQLCSSFIIPSLDIAVLGSPLPWSYGKYDLMDTIYSVFLLLPSSRSSFLPFFPSSVLPHHFLLTLTICSYCSSLMICHLSGMDFPSLSSVQLMTPSFSPHLFQTSAPHSSIPPSHSSRFVLHFQVQLSHGMPQGWKSVVWAQSGCTWHP